MPSNKLTAIYLRFGQFSAVVDHANLRWLLNLKQPSGRLIIMHWKFLWLFRLLWFGSTLQSRLELTTTSSPVETKKEKEKKKA